MTREEAIKQLQSLLAHCERMCSKDDSIFDSDCEALKIALAALRHQIWEDQLWHDAKTDPPKTPGKYYGKKDDANSMYLCQYRDGIWKLDMYPNCKIDIVQWADYTAFVDRDEESVLRPVAREQVEKVWKGEWTTQSALTGQEEICEVNDAGHILGHDATCPYCGEWLVASDEYEVFANFCPSCGKAMSKKAIDIVMERMKELESNDD